jgi:uncharacterized damage-inducible protein DinB
MKPLEGKEFDPYYSVYINKVDGKTVVDILQSGLDNSLNFYKTIPEDKWSFSYAKGKWTIKEILLHLIDVERVFAYRAFCVSRKEKLELPGFDHDEYLKNSNANSRSVESLLEEYVAVRKASITLFKSFNLETLEYLGVANGSPISARALAYIIAGHELHHNGVIKERYL